MAEFINSIFKGFFIGISAGISGILPYFAVAAAVIVVFVLLHEMYYRKGSYYVVTKLPFIFVRSDLGRYGEYLIYKNLKSYEKRGARFLFNVYVPKENDETTEIDVVMICSKGLIVFESKNYSGWIFGNDKKKNWYQTLPNGRGKSRKESFYNPIFQNNSHIKHLRNLVGEEAPVYSIIAFSDRCTLKKIEINDKSVPVVNRGMIGDEVSKIYSCGSDLLNDAKIAEIYDLLYPLTLVKEADKQKHVDNIRDKYIDTPVSDGVNTEHDNGDALTDTEAENCTEDCIANEYADLACPMCGGKLVLRTSKKGEHVGESFYGCSNYPKCRYIKKLSKEKTDDIPQ